MSVPTFRPKKPAGVTPMTVNGTCSTTSVRPIASAGLPNSRWELRELSTGNRTAGTAAASIVSRRENTPGEGTNAERVKERSARPDRL